MGKFEWRPDQIRVANKTLLQFDEVDNVVLNGPTGSGKSGLAYAIHDISLKDNPKHKTLLLCHQRILQDQYSDFLEGEPGVMILKGKSNYKCALAPGKTVDTAPCHFTNKCRFKDMCEYWKKRLKISSIPLLITNYQMVLSLMNTKTGWGRESDVLICDECFVGTQEVMTEIGSVNFRKLYNMYKNGISLPKVWSYNINGALELKGITKVWKTTNKISANLALINAINVCSKIIQRNLPLTEDNYRRYRNVSAISWDKLMSISTIDEILYIINNENIKKKLVRIRIGSYVIICSYDHYFMLKDKTWVPAQRLKVGNILLGKYSNNGSSVVPMLNGDQYQLLLGSFLGDGGVRYNHKHTNNVNRIRLRCNHGDKQERYLRWKSTIYNREDNITIGSSGFSNKPVYRFTTRNIDVDNYFPDRKGDCPEWVLDHLDAKGLAIWFMDDGSCGKYDIRFNTQSFNINSINMIKNKLFDKWNIKLDVRPEKGKYYILCGGKDARDIIFNLISPFLTLEMPNSKLKWFDNIEFSYKWDNEYLQTGSASVLSIEMLGNKSDYYNSSLYDLEVEDNHNYIVSGGDNTGGVIAHNSHNIPSIFTDYRKLTANTGEIPSYEKAAKILKAYDMKTLAEVCEQTIGILRGISKLRLEKKSELLKTAEELYQSRKQLIEFVDYALEDHDQLIYDNNFMSAVGSVYDRDSRFIDKYIMAVTSSIEHIWDVKTMDEFSSISLTPLEIHEISAPILESLGHKRMFMSATVFRDHSMTLGLDDSVYIQLPNNIPVENRPIIFNPIINMNASTANAKSPEFIDLCDTIVAIVEGHKGESGVVFTPSYNLASMIRNNVEPKLSKLGYHILINYDANGRDDVLETFRTMKTKNKILISPSFNEGVNFEHDIARFGIVTKAPFMSLGDNYVKVKMKKDKRWYELEALTALIQMCGRTTRAVDDYSIVYLLDKNCLRLYEKYEHEVMKWFRDSVQFII